MSKKSRIWLSSPHMGGSEQAYIKEAFDTNWIAPLGPNVNGFEVALESYFNNEAHIAALSSGTAAIHLGLKILGVGYGDVVLCQSFTFSASANPISYLGATPIFIDSEKETWNLCPNLLETAIKDLASKGVKPKAIIAVHLYGMPYKVMQVNSIAKKYDIPILEDSAEALGSKYDGSKCGSFGDIGVLSFNGNKIITTSGGGALVSKKNEYKKEAIFLATQSRDDAPHYQHSKIGHNYRMSNIVAGIGRGQMEVLDSHVSLRRKNYDFYRQNLAEFEDIEFLDEPKNCFSNRWLTTILTPDYKTREQIRLKLWETDIESRPLWKPMHEQPVFKDFVSYTNGVSSKLFERGLCLPSGSNLSDNEKNRIIEALLKVLK